MAHPGGRPVEYTPERIQEIAKAMEVYINNVEIPSVAEFAYLNNIRRTAIYELEELSDIVDRLIAKKEFTLERKGLNEEVNVGMAKFSLAQLGWREKQEIDHTL